MFCGKCGNQITNENAKFCPVCGNAIRGGPVPVHQEYTIEDNVRYPEQKTRKKDREKLTAGTLTLNKIISVIAAVILFWDLYLPFIGYADLVGYSHKFLQEDIDYEKTGKSKKGFQ